MQTVLIQKVYYYFMYRVCQKHFMVLEMKYNFKAKWKVFIDTSRCGSCPSELI